MAWSTKGAEKMAAMRTAMANGESVSEHYLAMHKRAPEIVELKQEIRGRVKKNKAETIAG